jgi:predicted acetyltransferase
VSFDVSAEQFVENFTGVTVAVDAAGSVHGFASWNRGHGYGEHAVLEVSDLLARSAAGYRALLRALGSFSSVTRRTWIDTSGDDLVRNFLPSSHWRVVESRPYMLKILDVRGALSARRYPPGFSSRLAFSLMGDFLTDLDGAYRLEVDDGRGRCLRAKTADRNFTALGLALLYAGAQSSANLRAAGHLQGGDVAEDLVWDALFGGRQQHIRDYF